jgi:hypothetical protein
VDLPLRSPAAGGRRALENQRHGGFRGLCSSWNLCLWRRLQDSRPLGSVRASREERTRLLISVTVSAAACDAVPTHLPLPMGSETSSRGSTQVDRRESVRHSGVHRRFPVPPSVTVTTAAALSALCSTAVQEPASRRTPRLLTVSLEERRPLHSPTDPHGRAWLVSCDAARGNAGAARTTPEKHRCFIQFKVQTCSVITLTDLDFTCC